MNVSECINILKQFNYREPNENEFGYEYVNGCLSSIDMYSPTGKRVNIVVEPVEEYIDEIINNPNNIDENEEFNWEYDRILVLFVKFESSICNIMGYVDGDKSYLTLDGVVRNDNFDNYIPHKLNNETLTKFAWIQEHPIEHELFIVGAHYNNLRTICYDYIPILEKYDFYQSYSSVLDCRIESGSEMLSSNPFVRFNHKYYDSINYSNFTIETDCITGELLVDGKRLDKPFEKWLTEDFMYDKKYNCYYNGYRYLFNKDYKPESYKEMTYANELFRDMKFPDYFDKEAKINWDLIPESEMPGAYEELKQFMENLKNK